LALVLPELAVLSHVFADQLEEQGCGEIGEAFAHPLIAIGVKADGVSPPLVSDFVRAYDFVIPMRIESQQFMARGGVKEVVDGQVDKPRPSLPVAPGALLRNRNTLV
jgi:hypothetical protein